MDKLTAIRIKYDDGTYSDEIPINVLAENVEWDNTNNLIDILGSVAIDDQGSIQEQLDQLFSTKVDTTSLNNYIDTSLKEDVEDWLDQYVSPATGTIAYDASLSIEGAAADAKAAGEIVQISSTKPIKENNRIWVASAEEEYQIPTIDEFNILKSDLKHDIYITNYDADLASDNTESPTTTIIADTLINRSGVEVQRNGYNIASFTASSNKIYKIQALTGTSYNNIRLIELISDSNVIAYDFPNSNATITRVVRHFEGVIRVCYRAVNQSSLKITEMVPSAEAAVDTLRVGIIDPDDYSGSDYEKIEAAMAEIGNSGHGVILIKRMYNLVHTVNISHNAESTAKIIFLGCGNGCGFSTSTGIFMFKSVDSNASYGSIDFVNINFKNEYVCFFADYVIRIGFDGCVFDGGRNVVKNSRYMQSWHFNRCLFRNLTHYIIYSTLKQEGDTITPSIYDVVINGCLVERSMGLLYAQKAVGTTISECCIEGLWGPVGNIVDEAKQFNVVNNYFEHNNNRWSPEEYDPDDESGNNGYTGGRYGVHFNFSSLKNNLSEVRIVGNLFMTIVYAPDEYNSIILLPYNRPNIGYFVIADNYVSYGDTIYLVKAHNSSTIIYKNVILRNNLNANYDGGSNNLLIDSAKGALSHINEIGVQDDLNTLSNPGVYHSMANEAPQHSPTSGELYLIHLRSDQGFAQIAVTPNGISTRIGTGEFI